MGLTGFNRARRAIALAKKRAQAVEKPEETETKVDSETEKPAVKKASKK